MTHPPTPRPERTKAPKRTLGLAALVSASFTMLAACSDPPPEPAPEPRQTVPVSLWSIEDLEMDERVQFPERYLPSTTRAENQELAQAMADIATGMLTGDNALLEKRLGPSDIMILEILTNSGELGEAANAVQAVRIVQFQQDDTVDVGIAYENASGAFLTAWSAPGPDNPTFAAMAIEPQTAERLAQLDDAELIPPVYDESIDVEALMELAEQRESTRGSGDSSGRRGSSNQGAFGGGGSR